MRNTIIAPLLLTLGAAYGCGGGGEDLPTTPPTRVEMVAESGFQLAGAVAASPDGETFYVAAYTMDGEAAVFTVDPGNGAVDTLHVGAPLLYPSDLATSCDGDTLFVSDMGFAATDDSAQELSVGDEELAGAIHTLATNGGDVSKLDADGILYAAGIVVSVDCDTLYVSGWADDGQPAVFTVPTSGGAVRTLYKGSPLVSPTGIHVDRDKVAWVMDHAAAGEDGDGLLFSITDSGDIDEVVSGVDMGRHGGVSLTPGGETAVIPTQADGGTSQLVTANTRTGEIELVETPDIANPTGTASALKAPVMVIAGESSIHIATFE